MDRRYKTFTLKNIQAPNFLMTAMELKDYIDFPVKRIYFISAPTGEYKTNSHAHRQEEDELFVMIQGSCKINVDDGHGVEPIELVRPRSAIYIPHMVWHGFTELSPDAIILAVTSTNYDPTRTDYVENYEEFKKLVRSNSQNLPAGRQDSESQNFS